MTVIAMSDKELDRMQVLRDLSTKQITVSEAAGLMRLTRRQVFRLAKCYRQDGPAALVSRRRGRPSNRSHPTAVRAEALALIKANYADFGPTLAAEKLAERHGLRLGVETLRQWMRAEGIWTDRQQRLSRVYQPRYRRASMGELIQIDGSEHWWFEDRGPQCTLLAFVDDATSRIMHARFVATESTFDYFRATRAYLEHYGKPVAFYSDKHAIFRVNSKEARGGDGMTQFGRALDELTIEIICANAPQSKGRVERCFGTLQDRLVKELRRGWQRIPAGLPGSAQCAVRQGPVQRPQRPPAPDRAGPSRRSVRLEGGADGHAKPDAAVRSDALPSGAERGDASPGAPACDGLRLSGRASGDQAQGP